MAYITSVSPAYGSKVNGSNPSISVSFMVETANTEYDVNVWFSANPTNQVANPIWFNSEYGFYSTTGTKTLVISADPAVNLAPGTYYAYATLTLPSTGAFQDDITTQIILLGTATTSLISPNSGEWLSSTDTNAYNFNAELQLNKANSADSIRAYQVVVNRQSDNALVYDSGEVPSFASSTVQAAVSIPNTYKNTTLVWKARLWNAANQPTAYTATRTLTIGTAPTVTVTSPTQNQVLSTGVVSVGITLGTSGGRTVEQVVTALYTGTTKLWEVISTGSRANGSTLTVTKPDFFYSPNVPYYYSIQATDSMNLKSLLTTRNFTAVFSSPANPGAVTVSTANYDTSGYVGVSFPDTGRDADFLCWEVQREDALIDPNTQVVYSTGAWTTVGRIYTPAASYEFRDYFAPSNYQVRYRVRQVALKFNAEVTSTGFSTTGYVYPVTQCYWLLSGTNGFTAQMVTHRLSNVTADDYSDETEEAEFVILGRGRYIEKGTYLGVKGTLTAQLRDSAEGTARLKKQALEIFKRSSANAWLRNPFGDQYSVTIGNLGVGRIAGTGSSEHVDISVPYTETIA